jgi:hypothetical protein
VAFRVDRSTRGESTDSWFATRTRPRSGRSSPMISRNKVDLPFPDPPTMAIISPRCTSKVMPSSTLWLPNDLYRFSMRISRAGDGPASRFCVCGRGRSCSLNSISAFRATESLIEQLKQRLFLSSSETLSTLCSCPILKARPQSRVRPSFRENFCLCCKADLRLRLLRTTPFPVNANFGARVFAL